jgi:hypothetical protein
MYCGGEWYHLCAQALSPAAVSDGPLIGSGQSGNDDVAVHGFWRHGGPAIFDVRVTDNDTPYHHRGQDPHKILLQQEKEKEICTLRPACWLGTVPSLLSYFW